MATDIHGRPVRPGDKVQITDASGSRTGTVRRVLDATSLPSPANGGNVVVALDRGGFATVEAEATVEVVSGGAE